MQIDIRKVANGFVVEVFSDDEPTKTYIFDRESKVLKFLRDTFKAE